jgi:TolA-binding protein
MKETGKGPAKPAVDMESSLVEWFTDDIYPRYAKQIWVAGGTLIAAVLVYFIWTATAENRALEANRDLGASYVLLADERFPEAEKSLTDYLRKGPSGLARDKAYLFLGKAYYRQEKYDQALEAYGMVGEGKEATALIRSGALHGIAASLMQKRDYAQAAARLEEFVARAMRRTGHPSEDIAGQEVQDLSPSVPNALWKLALCYRELKQPEKAKAAVEKLRRAYPASREAQDGERLLATLE